MIALEPHHSALSSSGIKDTVCVFAPMVVDTRVGKVDGMAIPESHNKNKKSRFPRGAFPHDNVTPGRTLRIEIMRRRTPL